MPKTINRVIEGALLAKYRIHPIPQNLTQSIAISRHFQGFSKLPLIQYTHGRDSNTGKRSNWIRLIAYDPLPPLTTTDGGSVIEGWRKHMAQVYQTSYQTKLNQYQTAKAREPPGSIARDILKSIPSFTTTPSDEQHHEQKSAILISQQSAPSNLELDLLNTSQIILDSNGNLVSLETSLENLKQTDEKNEYTIFTLDLILMTREPEVITHAARSNMPTQRPPTPEQEVPLKKLYDAILGPDNRKSKTV